MSDTLPPLTSAELADLKADTRDPYRLFPPSTVLRLIAMVERRDGQIIELREVIKAGMLLAALVERPYFKQKCREALAATEPGR